MDVAATAGLGDRSPHDARHTGDTVETTVGTYLDGGIDLDATDAFVGALEAVPGEHRHCSTCACSSARPALRTVK